MKNKELKEKDHQNLKGIQTQKFVKPINLAREDADIETEQGRTDPEKEMMDFMDETLNSFSLLLGLDDIDSDIRGINKDATAQAIKIYRTEYAELLEKMGGFVNNPTILLKQGKIANMISRLESKYRDNEPQVNILEEMQNISERQKQQLDSEEEKAKIEQRVKQEDALISFMDETLNSFSLLLGLDDIDSDMTEINKSAAKKSIAIYRAKYAELLEQMGGFLRNPNSVLKQSQVEHIISRLESKYSDRNGKPQVDILAAMPETSKSRSERSSTVQPVANEQKAAQSEQSLFSEEVYSKAHGDVRVMMQRKYSLADIKDSEMLQKRLTEMFYDGMVYSADPNDNEKVARLSIMKQVIPQYDELRNAIVRLREIDSDYERELYENLDYESISYEELLGKANIMIAEKEREEVEQEKSKGQEESIRDEVGNNLTTKTQEEQQSDGEVQTLWMNRLQDCDQTVDRMQEGAKKKQDVVKFIQDLEQERRQDRSKQQGYENSEQR